MPFSAEYKQSKAHELHKEDWEKSSVSEKYMFKCMHLTMLMQNRRETR